MRPPSLFSSVKIPVHLLLLLSGFRYSRSWSILPLHVFDPQFFLQAVEGGDGEEGDEDEEHAADGGEGHEGHEIGAAAGGGEHGRVGHSDGA